MMLLNSMSSAVLALVVLLVVLGVLLVILRLSVLRVAEDQKSVKRKSVGINDRFLDLYTRYLNHEISYEELHRYDHLKSIGMSADDMKPLVTTHKRVKPQAVSEEFIRLFVANGGREKVVDELRAEKCKWSYIPDYVSDEKFEECLNIATHTSCDFGNVCEQHTCRCSKPLKGKDKR